MKHHMAQHMQGHDQDQRVRCVAVQTAQQTTGIGLILGQCLHGCVGVHHTGFKKYIEIKTAKDDDPKQEVGNST